MTNEKLQELIYKFNILTDELGNAYILPTKGGHKFSPLKKEDIPNCVTITKEKLIGLLDNTLIFNPTTKLCEPRPYNFSKEKARIVELKKLLAETDYQAIKYAEGIITYAEYEEVRIQRIAWRAEINGLEEIINA